MALTDRDVQNATFKAVAQIYRHLTGQVLEVAVATDVGRIVLTTDGDEGRSPPHPRAICRCGRVERELPSEVELPYRP